METSQPEGAHLREGGAGPASRDFRLAARIALSVLYSAAGVAHLAWPDSFLPIMPEIIPFPRQVIIATGALEIAGALALHLPRLMRPAGVMLALYALCVWPANFKHAMLAAEMVGLTSSWWYHGPRLALQPALIWLALWATGASARQRLDRTLQPVQRQGKHAAGHELADHADRVGVAPVAEINRIEPG